MQKPSIYQVVGVMSGTSLDGLDLLLCEIARQKNRWLYKMLEAKTVSYSQEWKNKLSSAFYSGKDYIQRLDREFGVLIGKAIMEFLKGKHEKVDLVASHGHTIFHNPKEGISLQIGNGQKIADITGIVTVCNFRKKDVELGGQGAPLVPVGDEYLFPEFDYCLNLGGFSNISFKQNDVRVAYDICPVNMVLNRLCPPMDKNGDMGRRGKIDVALLEQLNNLEFYTRPYPKSLSREWFENTFLPVLDKAQLPEENKIRTVYEHIAEQIVKNIRDGSKVLVTGGGAFNRFLIELFKQKKETVNWHIPDKTLVKFKEALVFALLGILKINNEINVFASVTGAKSDSISGEIFYPGRVTR